MWWNEVYDYNAGYNIDTSSDTSEDTASTLSLTDSDTILGEILTDGIEVKGILRIKGNEKDKYYKIYSQELKDYIYVTGTHLIMHPKHKSVKPDWCGTCKSLKKYVVKVGYE